MLKGRIFLMRDLWRSVLNRMRNVRQALQCSRSISLLGDSLSARLSELVELAAAAAGAVTALARSLLATR